MVGPGRWSLDHAFGIDWNGWTGAIIAGVVGVGCSLTATGRQLSSALPQHDLDDGCAAAQEPEVGACAPRRDLRADRRHVGLRLRVRAEERRLLRDRQGMAFGGR